MKKINSIPQGYKQTELGIIPEDWEVKTIASLGNIVGGGTPSTIIPAYWDGGIQWFTPAEIGASKYISKSERSISKLGLQSSAARILPKDAILLTTRASIGLSAILLNEATTNQGFQSIIVNTNHCNEYAYYALKTKVSEMLTLASGSTFAEISKAKLASIKLPIPPIAEQRAIAEALSDVDGLIAALDKKIAKKRLVKQGAMQQLLTGKTRLPSFTDEWEYIALEDLLEYEQPTKYLVSSTEYTGSGIPVLTAGKTFILGYTTETTGIYTNIPVIIFDDFTTDSKFVTFPFKAKSSAMKMLQLKDKRYNLRLIYELMQLIQFPLYDHQRYWISEYSKLQVYIPSDFKEQQAIATILSDMDKEIADFEAQRDKYRLLKSGMMQKLLTGQVRLKNK